MQVLIAWLQGKDNKLGVTGTGESGAALGV
jgi:hypothetical protein